MKILRAMPAIILSQLLTGSYSTVALAADPTVRDVSEACSGPIIKGEVVGGRGKLGDSGYEFEITPDKKFNLYKSGTLISSSEKFTYEQYSTCVIQLRQLLLSAPKPKACRIKANG